MIQEKEIWTGFDTPRTIARKGTLLAKATNDKGKDIINKGLNGENIRNESRLAYNSIANKLA